jgi:hypothetical protein
MKNYVNQLLEDLKRAGQNIPPKLDYKLLYPDHPAHDFGMEYMVAWECTPEQPISDLFGIAHEAFPPPERLTRTEMKRLNQGIIDLWAAFSVDVNIPPKRLSYNAIRFLRNHGKRIVFNIFRQS